jgi:hypothetical protein
LALSESFESRVGTHGAAGECNATASSMTPLQSVPVGT